MSLFPQLQPQPHPLAFFSLKPFGEPALAVVRLQSNQHLLSCLPDGSIGISIGHVSSEAGDEMVIATIGRNGDVMVEDHQISKIQCSFEIDRVTKAIMFHDKSHSQTSKVFGKGERRIPFRSGFPRKVLVTSMFNTGIGFGGVTGDLIKFELIWHGDPAQRIMNRGRSPLARNPRLQQTIDGNNRLPFTRGSAGNNRQPEMRVIKISRLGKGGFGEVYKGIDAHTGKFVAVKEIHRPNNASYEMWMKQNRDIRALRSVDHPHIIDYLGHRGLRNSMEIYMSLKDGSLSDLICKNGKLNIMPVADTVLHQMLQAVDYLTTRGIIHRDIKPDNILYERRDGSFHFYLGDFGACNSQNHATTWIGTPRYMAPEIFRGEKQTDKVDVWSLFVTILWALNTNGFREQCESWNSSQIIITEVLQRRSSLHQIQEMARENYVERASAAQMLVKVYNGLGLVTPRDRVPPL